MKNEDSRYLYVSGMATGMIMALVSVLVIFQMASYLETGGSYINVILIGVTAGIGSAVVMSIVINKLLRK